MYLINNPGSIFLILLTLAYVNCDNIHGPYNPRDDNEHKKCPVNWVKPAPAGNPRIDHCDFRCPPACRLFKKTDKWRCVDTSICECCKG